jgi:hypothetical protein
MTSKKTISHTHENRRVLHILNSKKLKDQYVYQVEWVDGSGEHQLTWESLSELYNDMDKIVSYKILERKKRGPLTNTKPEELGTIH